MTSTPTTPTNVKSSEPCEKEGSAVALTTVTGATAEEEEEVEDDGKTVALAKGGVTDLARTAGRTSLMRAPGGSSLMRTALRAMPASRRCRRHQGGTTTTIRMMGLGASRSRAPLLASWVVLRPRLPSASSSSLLAR